jgi:hypothetical protein
VGFVVDTNPSSGDERSYSPLAQQITLFASLAVEDEA